MSKDHTILVRSIPIERIEEDKQIVYGWAHTEDRVEQDGFTLPSEVVRAATEDYFKSGPALREMHSDAAGVVIEAQSYEGSGTYIAAKVVDPVAWLKVKEGVYRAFSISGQIKEIDWDTGIVQDFRWIETSLVDRPADPGAKITLWRSQDARVNLDLKRMKEDVMAVKEPVIEPTAPAIVPVVPEPIVRDGKSGDVPTNAGDVVVHETLQRLATALEDIGARLTKLETPAEPIVEEPVIEHKEELDPGTVAILARMDAMATDNKTVVDALTERLNKIEETPANIPVQTTFQERVVQTRDANLVEVKRAVERLDALYMARDTNISDYEQSGGTKEAQGIFGALGKLGYFSLDEARAAIKEEK